MSDSPRIAVLGLAEGGAAIAERLRAAGLEPLDEERLDDATLVLAVGTPMTARRLAQATAPRLAPGARYVSLALLTPSRARALAELLPEGAFVDGAVLGIPGDSDGRRVLLAGPGAADIAELLAGLGVDAEALSEEVGAASTRAQLHSLLVKGVAATLVDVLWAAEVLGDDAGAHAEILRWFEEASAASAQALLRDTAEHHKTRQLELTDVSEMLAEAGYEPTMTDGIGLTHSRLLHSRRIPHAR